MRWSYLLRRTVRFMTCRIFPLCGFAIQYVFVLLYFAAWDNPSPFTATSLKSVLPKGFFVPMLIEMILFGVVAALWVGNNKECARILFSFPRLLLVFHRRVAVIDLKYRRRGAQPQHDYGDVTAAT